MQLKREATELDLKTSKYSSEMKAKDKEDVYRENIKRAEEEYIAICKKRIAVASEIDYKRLSKVEIEDRKSPANQLFKWMLVCIYSEP